MPEFTITTKSRNLGLGWSNTPYQTYNDRGQSTGLGIREPSTPAATGGVKSLETELRRAARINGSAYWQARLFVGGQLVDAWWGAYSVGDDWETCEWKTGWLTPGGGGWKSAINEIINDLREGREVLVRTSGAE